MRPEDDMPRILSPWLRMPWLALLLFLPGPARAQARAKDPLDFGATLRVDLHHVGDSSKERYILDELRVEGPWPGPRAELLDRTGFGVSLFEIHSAASPPALLFSHTACTLYGEWRTTDEAKKGPRVFSETVRLPLPQEAVRLVVKTRDRRNRWVKVFETTLDPASVQVSRERRRGGLRVLKLHHSGPPEGRLDIVVLGDGYQAWQMDKYRQDARRFAQVMLQTEPFSRLRDRVNIWGVESPSRQPGVDEPRKGIFRDTALSMTFNTFGSARYLMTEDNKAVRDVAANAPYDAIYIMSNTGRYGGGGIYNLYASFISDNEYDDYVFVHEFGHSFAGLADEYYTSKVAYNEMYPRGVEPWEPNITAQRQKERVKWRKMIAEKTPVPTPAQEGRYRDRVGLFEGAGYSAKGLFRSSVDCKMFGKAHRGFCPVCMGAISGMIERYLR